MRRKSLVLAILGLTIIGGVLMKKAATPAVHSQNSLHPDYQLLVLSLQGDTALVRLLLSQGADPNTPPGPQDKGMTALMFATWKGHDEISRALANAGANVNISGDNGSSPLMYAAARGNVPMVNFLLARGANPNFRRSDGKTAVMFAALNGRLEVVRKLIAVTDRTLLNSMRFRGGDSLVHYAVKKGNPALLNAILSTNIDLEIRDSTGQTALMYASRNGQTQMVSKLLQKGANVNARDSRGVTSLTKAVIGNRIAVLQVLRAHRARS
ncbi:MAG: ankyrin repeat domain-containing protein [Pyrinomonadaceae bacterium]